jgi:sugar/nucleoside kinase (ribokinase family)
MRAPDVVIVGAATRDIVESDPRGWMLGGGVTFGALALARLGLGVGVVLGLDEEAATAPELELIRAAGAEIAVVPLASGPIFTNIETLAGRIQLYDSYCEPIPVDAVPDGWLGAKAWVFAPIAAELPDAWADVPSPGSCVALAWQGILRTLVAGEQVHPKPPGPSPFLARADIVAVSRHDLPSDLPIRGIGAWVGDACDVLLTAGLLGGMLLRFRAGQLVGARAYPCVPSGAEVDPTGAGDTMLAGLVAARLAAPRDTDLAGRDLRFGAATSSLLVEGPGMNSVPTLELLRKRLDRDR